MYQFRSLENVEKGRLLECLNLAFSDYDIPLSFTAETLNRFLTASAVDLSLSFGAFWEDTMVAVILNSRGIYNGERVVFDAGTGTVPKHRGKKVFSRLFDFASQALRKRKIEKYCLEVLQTNEKAIAIYKKKGFSVTREFAVLRAQGTNTSVDTPVIPYGDFQVFPTNLSVAPCFEHCTHTIDQNPQLYGVVSVPGEAYCICDKHRGAIIQLHYNDLDSLKTVLSMLLAKFPFVFAKNIDCRYTDVLEVMAQLGFATMVKQYEMAKTL